MNKVVDLIIDMQKEIQSSIIRIPEPWQNSKHADWFRNNNYAKGAHGSAAYKKFLEANGFEAKIISDEGDIKYRKSPSDPWIKAEVKAAKCDIEILKNGFIKESLWFNQLRPNQKGWDEAVLVGFYPNHIRIWRKTRQEWDTTCDTMDSTNKVLEHVGTDELRGVLLKKNTRASNFHEWECIHNDQQGDLL